MNILVLIAGTNDPSNSALLAQHFGTGMQKLPDVSMTVMRLNSLSLEQFSLKHYNASADAEPDFLRLCAAVQRANGLVIASPIWNFSVPAHLKNAIDRMGGFCLDTTRSRGTLKSLPFYLIFTGGAPSVAWKGLMRLTTSHVPRALQYYGASHFGTHYEGTCTPGTGVFGLVVDKRPESLAHMEREGERFAREVDAFIRTGKLPLRRSLMQKTIKLLQRFRR